MNPFIDAYTQSDLLGKIIFIGLMGLSVLSWIIIIYKVLLCRGASKQSKIFYSVFQKHQFNPLGLEFESPSWNPYANIYQALKKYSLEVLNKNRKFGRQEAYMSAVDIDFVKSHVSSSVVAQVKWLDEGLYLLSTVVSLAPFLGLLGTVWGILISLPQMQMMGNNVLGGISLALATTVLGLVDAIPALVGYNYLKKRIRDFEMDFAHFSNEMAATIEIQYRKVD